MVSQHSWPKPAGSVFKYGLPPARASRCKKERQKAIVSPAMASAPEKALSETLARIEKGGAEKYHKKNAEAGK
ncbi:MAG: hypothetical protein ACREJX_03205, partial [Polyangiaceae bacterium]